MNDLHNLESLDLCMFALRRYMDHPCWPLFSYFLPSIAYNQIKRIDSMGLRGLNNLKRFELTSNRIHRVEDLNLLKKWVPFSPLLGFSFHYLILSYLILSYLLISYLISSLFRYVGELVHLSLMNNSVTEAKGYRTLVLRRLPQLIILDNVPVTKEEKVLWLIIAMTVRIWVVTILYRFLNHISFSPYHPLLF